MKTPPTGRGTSSEKPTEKGRSIAPTHPRVTKSSPGPDSEALRKRSPLRGLVIGVIVALCLLAGGGVFVGVTLKKAAEANHLSESLKQAAYYEDKGEYEEALNVLNGLDIDNPKVKQLLDDVLTKKKASDEAARQQELSALLAQQQQLRAGLNELGEKLNQPQKIVIQQQPPPEKTAAENANAAEKERQKKVQDLLQQGAAAFNAGRYTEARKDFEQAANLDPGNANALAYAGLSYLREDPTNPTNVQKAVDLSNKAIDKNPDFWLPHRTLGEIYDSRKLADDAMKEYSIAARLNPNDVDTLFALGKLQYRAKQFPEAEKSFDACVRLRPDFTSAHFNKGMSLVQTGDASKAIEAFKSAIATKKDFPDAYYMLGSLLGNKGDSTGAIDNFRLAVQYSPNNPGFLRELGTAYMTQGDFANAEASYSKALALQPDNAVANYNMASVKIKLGKAEEALPFAQKAQATDDSAANAYILGLANEKLGNMDDAIKYYGLAVQKDPKFAPALINLGAIYDSKGMADQALSCLQPAVEIAPESYEAHNNLGNVFLHKQQFQDSIAQLTKALSLKPDARDTQYNLGLAYSENGQTTDAKTAFLAVLRIDPTYWDAYLNLARILIKEGNNKDATDILTKLMEKSPKSDVKAEAQKLLDQLK